jgi:hypothetical protein
MPRLLDPPRTAALELVVLMPGMDRACLCAMYEVKVGARLDERWSSWFEGFAVTPGPDGTTCITGPVADQAALHGLLVKVRDLGVTLISVVIVSD